MKKVALITGAAQGIGFETARLLGEKGYAVILADVQDASSKVEELEGKGIEAKAISFDLSNSATFYQVVEFVDKHYGRLDALVNNAAMLVDMGKHPSDLSEELFRKVMEVNYIGPFLFTQKLVPLLKKSESGRIVNLSTQVAQLAQLSDMNSPLRDDICAAYQSSKIGVNAMTVLFAKELEEFGIKVNSCCPGWVDSAMNTDELPDYGDEARPKTPAEGADTSVWLATLPQDGPTAGFFTDREKINW
ncbi:SDR family NAD(P)-dependent oxidoreductase [Flammeovirga yaeyamensis]|uniref:SDR family NAD(P)-dependent oxidoreductase n=1 Tax=Flammeovirga yaeyamensis TaxID=367791 RepID=A0AAX1N5G3_9BACT|nr:SDR family NAD(P)-dependent oxidoreductase [Flammeovirga yaeyamensis]MBB3701499.1 NAD(P)-dependent dehydrogenase (short-subunit alcohol dehydrogenase family) [Flammeovirga yaeyamensis]NMF38622.1 SDR family NAD(P)-dependent oxidoreductase [Flammeovirga yaeyamensis]QWG02715.1 SDR family NAD(P)-dependent oxidoreductase [Flammeovirga yaeyamensis]